MASTEDIVLGLHREEERRLWLWEAQQLRRREADRKLREQEPRERRRRSSMAASSSDVGARSSTACSCTVCGKVLKTPAGALDHRRAVHGR